MADAQVLVVGSGASAVHAAWALLEGGCGVTLIDVGERDESPAPARNHDDFLTRRRSDPDQWRTFLGERFEGIALGGVRVGAQLTPPRQFITRLTDALQPFDSATFDPAQSLALGGFAAGWGAVSLPYLDEELGGWPIGRAGLDPHYARVVERIGVCGTADDLTPFLGTMQGLLPPARLDSNGESVLARYRAIRPSLRREGFHLGAARLALCTQHKAGRGPCRYRDMEFWDDADRAVYRPIYTIEEMRRRFPAFRLESGMLAVRFEELAEGVVLHCHPVRGGAAVAFRGRHLVIAAGAFSTARIVARSMGWQGRRLPIVCNPYTYQPCVNLNLLGGPARNRRHSLTQLSMIYDPDGTKSRLIHPQLYSYRSLLLFKLMKESPLNYRDSRAILQALCDYFVIVGVHHEDRPAPGKWMTVEDDPAGAPGGRVRFEYRRTAAEERAQAEAESRVRGFLRRLRCWPLRRVEPGHGSSIHYAGTLPMAAQGGAGTCDPEGRLRGAQRVTIADGSTFPHLPAKGLTLTLMANADRVGGALAREICGPARLA